MSAPDWVTPDVMEKLRFLTDFGFQLLFGVYKQQEKSRLQGGLLLGEIVKNLTKMAASHPQQQLKLMMLSAHDTTVVALQASLNVFNGKQAPYASCHIIELYREDDGSASVSMFYRNDTGVEPYPVQLPGCAHVCPLEDFVRITKPFISDDRDKECQKVEAALPTPAAGPFHNFQPGQWVLIKDFPMKYKQLGPCKILLVTDTSVLVSIGLVPASRCILFEGTPPEGCCCLPNYESKK
ncbi:lysosomal acid phosphatase-like isoform X2 [Poecilia latipinna]|uniref:lysosomal acid phosphatase-like isoform X2 n=1 Tax=Poecilia latipinna TaxID=48699 RepID=UPI00072EA3C1|nr:PREDICTED: lysosomal acid phosphatase-like isoform X2 [Poecilia latipinna]